MDDGVAPPLAWSAAPAVAVCPAPGASADWACNDTCKGDGGSPHVCKTEKGWTQVSTSFLLSPTCVIIFFVTKYASMLSDSPLQILTFDYRSEL